MNSRTIREFPADSGTLVPERDNGDGTMIAHGDYGTLVPDSGTMVELESNLGTMVINSDSEDSTMKSMCDLSINHFKILCFSNNRFFRTTSEHDTNPDKPKYRPQFLDHFDRKKSEMLSNMVACEISAATDAVVPTAPVLESPPAAVPEHIFNEEEARRQQFPSQYQLHQIQQLQANHAMAQHQHQQQQHHQQIADIALNSEFVSLLIFYFLNPNWVPSLKSRVNPLTGKFRLTRYDLYF